MIEEELKKQEEKIKAKIQYYENLKDNQQRVKEQMLQNDREILEVSESKTNMYSQNSALPTTGVKNKIVGFFLKTFSSKYRKEGTANHELEAKIAELNEKINQLQNEKASLRRELSSISDEIAGYEDVATLRAKLEKQKEPEEAIVMLMDARPELRENKEFMAALIDKSALYVKYDKTDSAELYLKLADYIEPEIAGKDLGFAPDMIQKFRDELSLPKNFESDKYKIPHKYLFEAIKKSGDVRAMCSQIDIYKQLDGTLPRELGEKIQSMYEDKDHYLLAHDMHLHGENPERIKNNRKSICENGLMTSHHVNELRGTTNGTYREECSFMQLIAPADRIYGMIPKEAVDKKNVPIWGADTEIIDYNNHDRSYILPEYIVGYLDKETTSFMDNPVPVDDRKKYKYHFYEESDKGIEVIENKGLESLKQQVKGGEEITKWDEQHTDDRPKPVQEPPEV